MSNLLLTPLSHFRKTSVPRCNYPCNMSLNVLKGIHCKRHVRRTGYNLKRFQKTSALVAKSRNELYSLCYTLQLVLREKLQVGCSVLHSLFGTCLVICLGLQRLYQVELGSTFCHDFMDSFQAIASYSPRLQRVATWNGFLFPTLRDKLKRIAHCNFEPSACTTL